MIAKPAWFGARRKQCCIARTHSLLVLLTLPQPPTHPRILTNLTCAGGGPPTHPILYQVRKVLVKRSLTNAPTDAALSGAPTAAAASGAPM